MKRDGCMNESYLFNGQPFLLDAAQDVRTARIGAREIVFHRQLWTIRSIQHKPFMHIACLR